MGGRGSNSGSSLVTEYSSDYGKPGTYELYRVGNLDAPNGMIFLSASPDETALYSFGRDKSTGKNADSFEQYQLKIKNPLVVEEGSDRDNVIAAWKALHPGQDPGLKTSGLPARKWQQMDKQNAKALADSPYDAIIYKKSNGNHEVQIPKSSAESLKKTNSYKYSGQTSYTHGINGTNYSKRGDFTSFVSGPAYKNSSGRTVHRVDIQHWKFDKKKGFVKTKLVKGNKL